MMARPTRLALALLLSVTGSGCTLLDRESYSIMIRMPAHLYEPPPDPTPDASVEPFPVSASGISHADASSWVRWDLDELIEGVAPTLEPFRPFSYCHLHESSHTLESLVAVVVAPIEYPLSLATTMSSNEKKIGLVWASGDGMESVTFFSLALLWEALMWFFGPTDPPLDPYRPEDRPK